MDQTGADIRRIATPDFAASRGEYLNGVLLSAYLGWDFIDPKNYIKFDRQGVFAEEWTNELLGNELKHHDYAVIPAFTAQFQMVRSAHSRAEAATSPALW